MTKKRGRPCLKEQPMDRQVTIRLTQNEYENLVQYCFAYDLSPSEAIRWAMDIATVTGL
jgi:hypothetical protein